MPGNASDISAWPPGERPRERLLERGAQALSDAELLAVVLGTGCGGANALDISRGLLIHFEGSLRRLLSADAPTLLKLRGLGPARYATLMSALELARRHYREALARRAGAQRTRDHASVPDRAAARPARTRCSAACTSTIGTGSFISKKCSAAPSTAPAFTRVR